MPNSPQNNASNCTLDTHTEYDLKLVQFDKGTGKYAVKLANPPASCQSGFFTSKSATLTEDTNISIPKLTYTNHPVVLVPSKSIVQQVDSTPPSHGLGGFGWFLILALIGGAIYFAWKKGIFGGGSGGNAGGGNVDPPGGGGSKGPGSPEAKAAFDNFATATKNAFAKAESKAESAMRGTPPFRNPTQPSRPVQAGFRRSNPAPDASVPANPHFTHSQAGYAPPGQPVVVNNGNDGLLTGMVLGSMLSGNHHDGGGNTTVIHEREVIHDRDSDSAFRSDNSRSFSSEDDHTQYRSDENPGYVSDNRDDSFSSDSDSGSFSSSDSSYSSSSSDSSYSSDLGSSYGSDYGSSYSSDSGSSYSSDSGGGSFSSD